MHTGGEILDKSKGSFLWTKLVLKELSGTYGVKRIHEFLDNTPRDMEHLYLRIVKSMEQDIHDKELSKAILTWVTCGTRPLTIDELDGALNPDVSDRFPKTTRVHSRSMWPACDDRQVWKGPSHPSNGKGFSSQ